MPNYAYINYAYRTSKLPHEIQLRPIITCTESRCNDPGVIKFKLAKLIMLYQCNLAAIYKRSDSLVVSELAMQIQVLIVVR